MTSQPFTIINKRPKSFQEQNKIRQILQICVLFSILLIPGVIYAQEATVTAVSVEPAILTVGDPVTVQIGVQHPAGSRVVPPALNGAWGALEVLRQETAVITPNLDGSETSTLTLRVTAWQTGEIETPPLALQISDAAGNLTSLTADPIQLVVTSVLPVGQEQTLRELKPQATLAPTSNWPQIAGLGALALAALGIVLLGVRRLRQRPATTATAAMPNNRLPHEVALAALADLAGQHLPENGRFKPYYTELTNIVRRYLEAAYELPAMDRTTDEIRRIMRQQTELSPELIQHLRDTLDEADLVKFAKAIPTPETASVSMQRAREFIRTTASQAPTKPENSS